MHAEDGERNRTEPCERLSQRWQATSDKLGELDHAEFTAETAEHIDYGTVGIVVRRHRKLPTQSHADEPHARNERPQKRVETAWRQHVLLAKPLAKVEEERGTRPRLYV